MALAPLSHLSNDSQRQYNAVYEWFRGVYKGTMTHTSEMQAFIDNHPDHVVREGLRGRILRSIIGRYLVPPPIGPPIQLKTKRTKGSNAGKKYKVDHNRWLSFVPAYLHSTICHGDGSVEPTTADQNWMVWTQEYVQCLGSHILRRNHIRSYVAYVHRILRGICPMGIREEFLDIGRPEIVASILSTVLPLCQREDRPKTVHRR
jgi:hypothetical protein